MNAWLDQAVAVCLLPLACWILLSGLDDLLISCFFFRARHEPFPWPADQDLETTPERPIAVLVPLWHEHRVIGPMLERNLAVLSYKNYEVFVGVYPNDGLTERAVAEVAARYRNVHIARAGHDGPTSKGDCLNWIHRGMLSYEARRGVRFEIIMTHDAEDLIHPASLRLINWFSASHDMVQVPVLPLPTRGEWTHGLYCDEFAEYQLKDIPVRQRLGGFLPSNGVGCGFARAALDRLAATRSGHIFDPECLTEDYENGYRLHAMGFRQIFLPIRFDSAGPVATREYFPRRFRQAVRQRSRWVAGIGLQGWQHHGWRAPWRQIYWFWRDRKGLIGNLLAGLANLVFLYTFASLLRPQRHIPVPAWLTWICVATLCLALLAMTVRMRCAARIYGWWFAMGVPWRVVWGNFLNCLATSLAICQFLASQWSGRPLLWRKTEHLFPSAGDSTSGRPLLGELLVNRRWISANDMEAALKTRPPGIRLGEYLMRIHKLTEESLYQALSSQGGIPLGLPARHDINRLVTRTLPATALRRWKVLPYRVAVGHLYVLTSELPTEEMTSELGRFSHLEIRYRLVLPGEMEDLAENYLPKAG